MEFANLVRAARVRLGMSQSDLADRSALDQSTIAKVEAGKNAASSFRVRTGLAAGFGVDVATIEDAIAGKINLDDFVERAGAVKREPSKTVVFHGIPPNYVRTVALLIAYGSPPLDAEIDGASLCSMTSWLEDGRPDAQTRRRVALWANLLRSQRANRRLVSGASLVGPLTDRLISLADAISQSKTLGEAKRYADDSVPMPDDMDSE